ncbi:MAG: queuosine precursor transporter [Chitinophagales bacterium]|nr:queuosine precursor transporter [Chitinophagales bacterium]
MDSIASNDGIHDIHYFATMENIKVVHNKASRLFIFLAGFFIANALIAEFIGVKIFSLEKTLGFEPFSLVFFGQPLSFNLTCGVLLWPFVFILTDVINEYYGRRGVRFLSFLAVGLITYAFAMIFLVIHVEPADFWITTKQSQGISDMNNAFGVVFGQGLRIIAGSIVAFLVGQVVDVFVFHRIKKMTGEKKIWLRATGSTVVSQLIDSYVVLFIAFYGQEGWTTALILGVGVVNYIYKFTMAVLLTPLIYILHGIIDNYIGDDLAKELKDYALKTS